MAEFSFLSPAEVEEVFARFKRANPSPKSELTAPNPFTFLVSVVLSAQATDVSVNKATGPLFKAADTPQKMLALGEEGLTAYIKSIGLYRAKAKNVAALSAKLIADFGGKVPGTLEELESLPGVGRKTANVVLNVLFGKKTMPVDTHILRISPRIGLSSGKTPLAVEKDLLERIPESYMDNAHHWLILHGRYVCTARNPRCADCPIRDLCRRNAMKEAADD
ncbi:MAG: endonuclease III [Spirochaetaceae bacterium]|jgi:endonuclease-3|nr:endonuclease III [Spirochaetaceae bacterium]